MNCEQGGLVEPYGGHREAALHGRAGQAVCNRGSDAGTGRTSRAWVHTWKAHQVEENMALVLADMLWYREAWTRWMPALVRSLPGLVGGPGGSPGELA